MHEDQDFARNTLTNLGYSGSGSGTGANPRLQNTKNSAAAQNKPLSDPVKVRGILVGAVV